VSGAVVSPKLSRWRAIDPDGAITYEVADLSQTQPAYQAHFDLVASYVALNVAHDYQGFHVTLSAALKPGGRLVIVMNNPYSLVARGHSSDYFAASGQALLYRGLTEEGVKVSFWRRTMEEYLSACSAAVLQLERRIDAPTPEGCFKRRSDTLIPHFPVFTILSLVKAR
jgi:hypothetical protein